MQLILDFNVTLLKFSESKNLFVEHALQYSLAVAHGILEKNKKDSLHRLLLQGKTSMVFFNHLKPLMLRI